MVDALVTPEPLSLAKRQADVALRVGGPPEPYLVSRRLVDLPFAVYGTRAYLDARAEEKRRRPGWQAFDWVVLDQADERFPQARWEREHLTPDLGALRTNSSPLVFDAVRAGIGVAVLARASADTNSSLVPVSADAFDFGFSLWVVTHRDLKRVPRVRLFTDFIAAEVKRPMVGFPFR